MLAVTCKNFVLVGFPAVATIKRWLFVTDNAMARMSQAGLDTTIIVKLSVKDSLEPENRGG